MKVPHISRTQAESCRVPKNIHLYATYVRFYCEKCEQDSLMHLFAMFARRRAHKNNATFFSKTIK